MAPGDGEPGCEADVVCPVAGVAVAGGDFEALEAGARHHVGDAGHGLGPVRGGGAVAEDLDPFDHRQRQGVDVEEAVAHIIRHGSDSGATPVDERQGRRQPEAPQAELRGALEVVLLRRERRAGVGREVLQDVHGLRRAGGLEQLRFQGLDRRPSVVDRAPLDERADDHDLFDEALAGVPLGRLRSRGWGPDGGEQCRQANGGDVADRRVW